MELKSAQLELIQIDAASAPLAVLAGRRKVTTDYFCFLDDDDRYLEGSIDTRVAAIQQDDAVGMVVTNGRIKKGDETHRHHGSFNLASKDPMKAIFVDFWLASCGALYRTAKIPTSLFENPQPYQEWTWLAFVICHHGIPIRFIDDETYEVDSTTPGSASKTQAYQTTDLSLYERMLTVCSRQDIRKAIGHRISASHHNRSNAFMLQGHIGEAWNHHMKSLAGAGGHRYASYTLRLVASSVSRGLGATFLQR